MSNKIKYFSSILSIGLMLILFCGCTDDEFMRGAAEYGCIDAAGKVLEEKYTKQLLEAGWEKSRIEELMRQHNDSPREKVIDYYSKIVDPEEMQPDSQVHFYHEGHTQNHDDDDDGCCL